MLSLSEVSLSEEKCDGDAGFAVIKQSLLLSEVSLSEFHCSGSMFHIAPTKKKTIVELLVSQNAQNAKVLKRLQKSIVFQKPMHLPNLNHHLVKLYSIRKYLQRKWRKKMRKNSTNSAVFALAKWREIIMVADILWYVTLQRKRMKHSLDTKEMFSDSIIQCDHQARFSISSIIKAVSFIFLANHRWF